LRGDDGRSTGGCKRVTTTGPPFFSSSIRFSFVIPGLIGPQAGGEIGGLSGLISW
jgi:hypothetical protein